MNYYEMWQPKIDEVMDNFDFERVHRVMTFLDWKWHSSEMSVPTIPDMRVQVRRLIRDAINLYATGRDATIGTGGFSVTVDGGIHVQFILDEWYAHEG